MLIFTVDRHFTHTDVNVLLHVFCANVDTFLSGRWLGTELIGWADNTKVFQVVTHVALIYLKLMDLLNHQQVDEIPLLLLNWYLKLKNK